MSKATMDLDFFSPVVGENASSSEEARFQNLLERRRTSQGINAFMDSGIASERLGRKFIENGGFLTYETVFLPNGGVMARENPFSLPSTPTDQNHNLVSPLSAYETPPGTPIAPLTIFYNGTVSVFDVPRDKAETIMKLAEAGNSKTTDSVYSQISVPSPSSVDQNLLERLKGDLPITRKKSLYRFLEKRKERLTFVPPYYRH